MSDVHIAAIWDDEAERWWFDECEPGDRDDDSRSFEGDIPADLWTRREAAMSAWHEADDAISALLNLGVGQLSSACSEWAGDTYPGSPASWQLVLAASPSGDEWPIRDVPMGWTHDSELAVETLLDGLPDEFWLYAAGPGPVHITKDRLSIAEHPPSPPRSYDCHRCGHSRDEHGAIT